VADLVAQVAVVVLRQVELLAAQVLHLAEVLVARAGQVAAADFILTEECMYLMQLMVDDLFYPQVMH
jgi:hypothetical protein